ncbi:MAG TPA: hypothetical protein PKN32_06860 [Bacteroidales bacterium]|nr:hypothetical protein [Bacteroidales bacterium]
MIWLLFSILSSAGIYVIFKFVDKGKMPLLNIIVINYLIAAIFGFLLAGKFPFHDILKSEWLLTGLILGVLLIVLFFMVGLSSAKAGISITTVACKMAVAIPMVFAIIAYKESVGIVKIISIIFALAAVILSVYKKSSTNSKFNKLSIILPLALFIGMGIENSLLIFSKEKYINADMSSVYTASLFSVALLSGLLLISFKPIMIKNFANSKIWLTGTLLGLTNFGSIYFMLRALNSEVFTNSVTYGIVNIGIVTISVLVGTLFFKEKLSKLNISGVVISIIAIILLTYADSV